MDATLLQSTLATLQIRGGECVTLQHSTGTPDTAFSTKHERKTYIYRHMNSVFPPKSPIAHCIARLHTANKHLPIQCGSLSKLSVFSPWPCPCRSRSPLHGVSRNGRPVLLTGLLARSQLLCLVSSGTSGRLENLRRRPILVLSLLPRRLLALTSEFHLVEVKKKKDRSVY